MKNKYLMACLVFLYMQAVAYAQETPLVLEEALTSLEANAMALRILDKDETALKIHLEASKQRFLPQVHLAYTGAYTNSPLNTFGFKLEQQVVQQSDFAPSLLNNPDGLSNFNTKIQVLQPLFNKDAQLMEGQWQQQLEAVSLQREYALHQLQLELKNTYLQLQLLYATQEVLQTSENTMQAHLKIVDNFIAEGLGKVADQLAIQVKLKEIASKQTEVNKNIGQLSSYVAYLTGAEYSGNFKPSTAIDETAPSAQIWADSVSDTRADFMAYQKGIEAQNIGLAMMKAQKLPRLNAFGEFNLNDESPVGFGGNNFIVGVKLSWQLHLGQQLRSKVNAQQMAIEKIDFQLQDKKARENMVLQQAIASYHAIREQIGHLESSLALGNEQIRITQNRFKEGLEKSADVLTMNTQLLQTQLQIKQLYAQLKQSQNQIEFLLK